MNEIRELYQYNRWANQRVLGAVSVLSREELTRDLRNSFPSVLDTLVHIAGAEWIWLSRWRGFSPTSVPDGWQSPTLEQLRTRWDEIWRDQWSLVASLEPAAVNRQIEYRNLKGEPFRSTMGEMLRHVVNHSTYHRGQITTMLRQLGHSAAGTDLIAYYREKQAQSIPV